MSNLVQELSEYSGALSSLASGEASNAAAGVISAMIKDNNDLITQNI